MYDTKGQFAMAEPLYRRALAIWEEIIGPDHVDVAECIEKLAAVCRKVDKQSEAEELEKRAAGIRTKRQSTSSS